MSDIHGCYDDMIKMLEQIVFTDEDTLILAGDYIDRGSQSFEMLKWIESNPKNVIFLIGNHMMKKWIVLSTISIADVHPEIEGQMRNWHA